MALDFGYDGNVNTDDGNSTNANNGTDTVTDLSKGDIDASKNGEDVTDIGDITKENNTDQNTNDKKENDTDRVETEEALQEGTSIEVDGKTYTVDAKGNVCDETGNVYKEANEVQDWLKTFDQVDNDDKNNIISINSIQEAIGIEITDDNDKPITYDNTPEGINAYINAVIDTAREEHFEAAINTLYQKYPILNDVLNYYVANGNSLNGFGQMPDRSGIQIDNSNEAQHEAIIRTAWNERGQKGDVESYIAYLKSSGTLLATAEEELKALKESDEQYRKQLAEEAERKEQERINTLQQYWNGVYNTIKSRRIGEYEIPEQIIVNRNGQKVSVTPNDFFNYLYRVDQNGQSAYEKDLAQETPESRRDDEILRAYLKFVGGNYSNLVDMAINKEKVAKLKLKAKDRKTTNSIRITKPQINTKKEIDLGYN